MVVSAAQRMRGTGVAVEELMSEGNRGLTAAAIRYDASKNARLSTLAAFYIRKYMQQLAFEVGMNKQEYSLDLWMQLMLLKFGLCLFYSQAIMLGVVSRWTAQFTMYAACMLNGVLCCSLQCCWLG